MWCFLIVATSLMKFCVGTPVIGGHEIGAVRVRNQKFVVHNPAKYPYLVHLKLCAELEDNSFVRRENSVCGGVIVTTNMILSAAHCVNGFITEPEIKAYAGIAHSELETDGKGIWAKDFLLHENYLDRNGETYQENDILLIWLKRPLQLNGQVKLADLASSSSLITENADVSIAGWGQTETGYTSNLLREGKTKMVSRRTCQKAYFPIKISPSMLCTLSESKTVTHCSGDSGGPLVLNGVVIGIISWGEVKPMLRSDGERIWTCDPKLPTVYTKVSDYRHWIETNKNLGPPSIRGMTTPNQFPHQPLPPSRPTSPVAPCRNTKRKMCVISR